MVNFMYSDVVIPVVVTLTSTWRKGVLVADISVVNFMAGWDEGWGQHST